MISIPIGAGEVQRRREELVKRISREVHPHGAGRFANGGTVVEIFEIREVGSQDADHYSHGAGAAPLFAATASVISRRYMKRTTNVSITGSTVHEEQIDAPPVGFLASTMRLWRGDPAVARHAADGWDEVAAKVDAALMAVTNARSFAGLDWGGTNGAKFDRKCEREMTVLRAIRDAATGQADAVRQLAELQQEVDDQIRALLIELGIEAAATALLAVVTLGFDVAVGAAVMAARVAERATALARLVTRMSELLRRASDTWRALASEHRFLTTVGLESAARIGTGFAMKPDEYGMGDVALDVSGAALSGLVPEEKLAEVLAFLRRVHLSPTVVAAILRAEADDLPEVAVAAAEGKGTDVLVTVLLDAATSGADAKASENFERLLRRKVWEKYRPGLGRIEVHGDQHVLVRPDGVVLSVSERHGIGTVQDDRAVMQPTDEIVPLLLGVTSKALPDATGTIIGSGYGLSGIVGGAAQNGRTGAAVGLLDSLTDAALLDTLPAAPKPPMVRYEVRAGDTVEAIAAKVYGSPDEAARIVRANPGLRPDHIYPGDVLTLP